MKLESEKPRFMRSEDSERLYNEIGGFTHETDYCSWEGVKQFWDEVYEYIEKAYDTDALKIININGDGASWIKSGVKYIKQAKFVLDKYHMHKFQVREVRIIS